MRAAIPPLPNTPPWSGAQLKHRGKFTFTFVFYLLHCVSVKLDLTLRVFQKNFLRLFGSKKEEVGGGRRGLHNVELHKL
jgi:hypothetical protein